MGLASAGFNHRPVEQAARRSCLTRLSVFLENWPSNLSGSSAAGIRQFIKRSASVIMIDENEASKKRDEIMEMIRASSRGDRVLRGSAGHKGHEFTLRHIVWMGAIESGLKREADKKSVYYSTECLLPTEEEMAGKLEVPPEYELKRTRNATFGGLPSDLVYRLRNWQSNSNPSGSPAFIRESSNRSLFPRRCTPV